jgi:hypothetical protein
MRNATALATLMEGYWAMGDTIASHAVTMGALRNAQPIETGSDRNMWDGEFGRRVEERLQSLYERTMTLLEENQHEVLAVAHALETHKTIAGEDVTAVIEGTPGPTVDGRAYQDAGFRHMLENYHSAALRAHKEHGGVDARIPVPVPPPPPGALAGTTAPVAERPRIRLSEQSDDPD